MTAYGYNNLPEDMDVKALPIGIFPKAKDAFLEALESGHLLQLEAKAAYAYEYKGEMNLYSFADTRNTENNTDDVIIQLSIRMSNPEKAHSALALTTELVDSVANHKVILDRERQPSLKAEIAYAAMEARQAEAAARDKQQRMENVRKALTAEMFRAEEDVNKAVILANEKRDRWLALRAQK